MEIRTINKSRLQHFIDSNEYQTMPFVPISYHRAISHINNPRAEESDILLVLIYENGEMLGYMGTLPDLINTNSGTEKIAWLSCLWVNPKHRGRQIAQKLLSTCYNEYKGRIILTEYTEAAGRLYEKSGYFLKPIEKKGIKLYIKSDLAGILPPKKNIYRKLKPGLKLIDLISNLFIDLKFLKSKKIPQGINLKVILEIDSELSDFISANNPKQIFSRGSTELNHILQYPWILPLKEADNTINRYHFSAFDKSFEFIPVKVTDRDNKIIAFILFANRAGNLKMPYACYNKENSQTVFEIAEYYIKKLRVSSFITYEKQISYLLKKNKTPAFIKREICRRYSLSKHFEDKVNMNPSGICDGDGDCSFT
jgi:GNAT superfamily N-acetyltransferase